MFIVAGLLAFIGGITIYVKSDDIYHAYVRAQNKRVQFEEKLNIRGMKNGLVSPLAIESTRREIFVSFGVSAEHPLYRPLFDLFVKHFSDCVDWIVVERALQESDKEYKVPCLFDEYEHAYIRQNCVQFPTMFLNTKKLKRYNYMKKYMAFHADIKNFMEEAQSKGLDTVLADPNTKHKKLFVDAEHLLPDGDLVRQHVSRFDEACNKIVTTQKVSSINDTVVRQIFGIHLDKCLEMLTLYAQIPTEDKQEKDKSAHELSNVLLKLTHILDTYLVSQSKVNTHQISNLASGVLEMIESADIYK